MRSVWAYDVLSHVDCPILRASPFLPARVVPQSPPLRVVSVFALSAIDAIGAMCNQGPFSVRSETEVG